MDLKNEFVLFDPQKMPDVALPDEPGSYLIVLRNNSSLPDVAGISVKPVLIPFDYKGEKYGVVYVGKSSKSLRKRDLRQHFSGNAAISTFRKSIGCLLGFPLIMQDGSQGQNGKAKFCVKDEEAVTKWMKDNLLLFYNVNVACKEAEKELIRVYDPPLNIQGGGNGANQSFRTELSRLRASAASEGQKLNVDASGTVVEKSKTRCSNCGINLIVPDELLREKYIKCLEWGHVFKNPCYNPLKEFYTGTISFMLMVKLLWKALPIGGKIFVFIVLMCIWGTIVPEDRIADNGPVESDVMGTVMNYVDSILLKKRFDPDTRKSIDWSFSVVDSAKGIYGVTYIYKYKNSSNAYVPTTFTCYVDRDVNFVDRDGNIIE